MGDAGVMGGAAAGNMTLSGVETITGAKTFLHQKLILRNRADDASITLQNPVFTGTKEMFLNEAADFIVFVDSNDSNKVKAISGDTRAKEFEHATDLGNVLSSIHGSLSSTSGGTVEVKPGSYGWNTKLSVTKAHVGLFANRGALVTTTAGFVQDHISVEKDHFQIQDFNFNCTNQGNGNGSWLVAGVTTNSDFLKAYNNYVKSPGTHGIDLGANCGGGIIAYNQIQSFLAPTGDGIRCTSNADHEIIANGVGGFANATNGYGIRLSSAINIIVALNRSFVNRMGIRAYLATGSIITNNFTQSNTQYGIQVVNDTSSQKGRTIITGNRCHDNGTASANNYDGINIAISSTGGLDDLVITGNMCTDQNPTVGSKDQRYGISLTGTPALLTNSIIANNALNGNRTGGILRGTIDSTLVIQNNSGDTETQMTTLGDTVYGAASGISTRLAGQSRPMTKVLGQLGTGTASTAPAWVTSPGLYSFRKYGAFTATSSNGTVGTFAGNQVNTATGSTYTIRYDNTYGRVFEAATGTVAAQNAGWRTGITMASLGLNPRYWARFKLLTYTGTTPQIMLGFQSANAHNSGDDYLNALSGLAMMTKSTSTNFEIGYNEGTGATVFETAAPTTAIDTNWHTIEIWGDSANNRWLYQFDNGTITVVNSGAPTTQVPTANTQLSANATLATSDTNAKTMQVYAYEVEA